jgi:hypothetical protein
LNNRASQLGQDEGKVEGYRPTAVRRGAAGQHLGVQHELAFDSWLCHALVVETWNSSAGRDRGIDEADALIRLAGLPLHRRPSGPV